MSLPYQCSPVPTAYQLSPQLLHVFLEACCSTFDPPESVSQAEWNIPTDECRMAQSWKQIFNHSAGFLEQHCFYEAITIYPDCQIEEIHRLCFKIKRLSSFKLKLDC